jgi:NAD(P)-dependent dehydrogenase (short-subunit alcohol dehydrogenase family)
MLVLVVGGMGGIGKELVPLLEANPEYNVISLGRSDMNVVDWIQTHNVINDIKPDVLINLSGVNHDGFLHKLDGKVPEVEKMVNVNALGAINLLSSALPNMRKEKFGRIIMVSSVLSRKVVAGTAVYSATKAFVDSLVKTASAENISHGITCNSIRLGYFDAGMCHTIPENIAEQIKQTIPLKRWGNVLELYKTIDYLIKTEYITGQNIEISGGLP